MYSLDSLNSLFVRGIAQSFEYVVSVPHNLLFFVRSLKFSSRMSLHVRLLYYLQCLAFTNDWRFKGNGQFKTTYWLAIQFLQQTTTMLLVQWNCWFSPWAHFQVVAEASFSINAPPPFPYAPLHLKVSDKMQPPSLSFTLSLLPVLPLALSYFLRISSLTFFHSLTLFYSNSRFLSLFTTPSHPSPYRLSCSPSLSFHSRFWCLLCLTIRVVWTFFYCQSRSFHFFLPILSLSLSLSPFLDCINWIS